MITAVLLMAYGSPNHPGDIESYLTDIRGGRRPESNSVKELTERYRTIGGTSPLNEITSRQSSALQSFLEEEVPGQYRTYVGMKHWHPFIAETIEKIAADDAERIVGLALAPHYSKMSIGGYESRVIKAMKDGATPFEFTMISHWYHQQNFVDFWSANLKKALGDWDPGEDSTRVFFTAHSLPERAVADGDPYREQLVDSSAMIAGAASVSDWRFAFQSASETGEPWLGPDILDSLSTFAAGGGRRAIVAPVGFSADHLEILFDIDVECAAKCEEIGIEFRRTESPNDDPRFIEALGEAVLRA